MIIATLIADFHEGGFQQLYIPISSIFRKCSCAAVRCPKMQVNTELRNVKNRDHMLCWCGPKDLSVEHNLTISAFLWLSSFVSKEEKRRRKNIKPKGIFIAITLNFKRSTVLSDFRSQCSRYKGPTHTQDTKVQ